MRLFVCVDIGGTDIKYGLINESMTLLEKHSMPTYAHQGAKQMLDRIIKVILSYNDAHDLFGVAISSAGVVDPDQGIVLHTTGVIVDYDNTPVKAIIESATQLPVEINNDVNCFALCEAKIGHGQDADNTITLTIGTGIGGAIILNRQLYLGHGFSAGEWGRMRLEQGRFEDLASVNALIEKAHTTMTPTPKNGKDLFERYDLGDLGAKEAVDFFYHHLALGLSSLIYVLNPEKVILGGGITTRESFLSELLTHLKAVTKKEYYDMTNVVVAKYLNDSGMMGALIHFLTMEEKRGN